MVVIGIVVLTVIAVFALAKRSRRGITATVWIVGGAYALLAFGLAAQLILHGSEFGLAALGSGLAATTGILVHRSRPAIGAGLLMVGGLVLAGGIGLVISGLSLWGNPSVSTAV